MRSVRVVVADDDRGFRAALVDVLEADDRFTVAGVVASGEELVELASGVVTDLVLLDVRMPGGGPTAARRLCQLPNHPVVVAVSASVELPTVLGVLRAGATGYLMKGQLGQELPDLLARCASGQVILAVPNAVGVLRALLEGRG
jgi:two-component system nitrate/nitrite response regulator NarL